MIKNTIILLVLYFLQFYLTIVCREKNILPNKTNSQKPGVFGSLEPEPLEKKSGAGAVKKFAGSPALSKSIKPRNRLVKVSYPGIEFSNYHAQV